MGVCTFSSQELQRAASSAAQKTTAAALSHASQIVRISFSSSFSYAISLRFLLFSSSSSLSSSSAHYFFLCKKYIAPRQSQGANQLLVEDSGSKKQSTEIRTYINKHAIKQSVNEIK